VLKVAGSTPVLHAPAAPGEAILEVAQAGARTVVVRAAAMSPLRLLLPRNHGHAVWAYQASLGGGLVDGDHVTLRVRVGAGATALVTTQASTKVYRSPRGCRQRVEAEVADGGLLILAPDPTVCFAGARLAQETTVRLGEGASLVLIDAITCGRAASGERWAFASYRSAVSVRRGDALLLRDAIELDAAHGDIAARMGRFEALATVIAAGPVGGPAGRGLAHALAGTGGGPRALCRSVFPWTGGDLFETSRERDWIAAPSRFATDGMLVRAAATSAERLHRGVRALMSGLPSLLGDDPFARKW
jgi:urease accessory protein